MTMKPRDDLYVILLVSMLFAKPCWCLYPFQNTSLDWEIRVNNLLDLLSLDEQIGQLSHGGAGLGPAPSIERLGVGLYQWDTECLRGDAQAPGNATSFPQAIGLAASFSQDLIFDVAEATGVEVRAKHNTFLKKGYYGDHTGISCFSPVINIMRHPLWGRNQETYGEDPYLSGQYAASFVRGLQGNHTRYVRANAGCKHFAVHGGPEDIPESRFGFNAKVSLRDLHTTFLPAFRDCVKAGSMSVMCSYNRINGIPACADKALLTDILRKNWNFSGYVVSDENALENIVWFHKYLKTYEDTAAMCVNAGTNLELSGVPTLLSVYHYIGKAIQQGKISKTMIRERARPLMYTRMRLGEFDPHSMNPYSQLNESVIQSEQHRGLSLRAAMMSFVLLKNTNNFLPLKIVLKNVAIVGPMADNPSQLFGDYAPRMDKRFTKTPLDGLRNLALNSRYASGCLGTPCLVYDSEAIKEAVDGADLVIVCLGTGQEVEMEGKDRINMDLPGHQQQLYLDSVKYGGGAPVIVILFNAGPLDVTLIDKDSHVVAILEAFFPAQAAGHALFNVLTMSGPHSNPAGRLPFTWPASMLQVPEMTNYTMEGRTYRYFCGPGDPLYPFGFGLSYTYFNYDSLKVMPSVIKACQNVSAVVRVSNVGAYPGDEVVQLYISWTNATVPTPKWQLVGFRRVWIHNPGTVEVQFNITARQMSVWVDSVGFQVQPGDITVYAGGQQPNQTRSVGSHVLKSRFTITGSCNISL